MVVGGSSSRWVCAPVTAVAVGRVGYHAHREEEPPPVDHSHGRRRQAAAASLEASYGTRWHRVDEERRAGWRPRNFAAVAVRCGPSLLLYTTAYGRTTGPTCRLAFRFPFAGFW